MKEVRRFRLGQLQTSELTSLIAGFVCPASKRRSFAAFLMTTPLRTPSITNSTPWAVNVLASLRKVESRASVLPCSDGLDWSPGKYLPRWPVLCATSRGNSALRGSAGRAASCPSEADCYPNWLKYPGWLW